MRRLLLGCAVLAATLGVYFLVGGPWATAIEYEFAGPTRPVLGAGLLGLAVLLLALDTRRAHGDAPSAASVAGGAIGPSGTSATIGSKPSFGSNRSESAHSSDPSKAPMSSKAADGFRGTIVLYTREPCSLCDEARAILATLAAEHGYVVWEEDVDKDAALAARYGERVPVARLGDEELFELKADVARLRAWLSRSA